MDEKIDVLPPLSPTPVPLCVMDISMGTDHLKHTDRFTIMEDVCDVFYLNSFVLDYNVIGKSHH